MADATKQLQISSTTLFSEFKNALFFMRRRRTMAFAYGFVFVFVAFTAFMAFNPSYSNSASPWLSSIFSKNAADGDGGRSQFTPIFSYFFPDDAQLNSSSLQAPPPGPSTGDFGGGSSRTVDEGLKKNQTAVAPVGVTENKNSSNSSKLKSEKQGTKQGNNSTAAPVGVTQKRNSNNSSNPKLEKQGTKQGNNSTTAPVAAGKRNGTEGAKPVVSVGVDKGMKSNYTASLKKKVENGTRSEKKIEGLFKCDFFDGNWVKDESYPLYKPGSCSLIDEQFSCVSNGRPDRDFMKMKWKPTACTLPRLEASHMLELLRGKRLVYVGDSLNRNMWESMICILRGAVKNQSNVYEASGKHHFRGEASYSFLFKDYNFSVEFFVSPFLVQEWEVSQKNGAKKETLRLDLIGHLADSYKGADYLIFNTGHWWTHDKTSKGEDYYQEGSHIYHELNVLEAFRKALTTWGRWVDRNVDPSKTHVFFRGYSASHFSGGQWNSGGQCDSETEPIRNETYLTPYPAKMSVLERVIHGMKTPVSYLNITRITDFRKDGHPSIYRKQHLPEEERKAPLKYQDCSHWCLPGVPDTWNEILYAELLRKDYQRRHKQKTK